MRIMKILSLKSVKSTPTNPIERSVEDYRCVEFLTHAETLDVVPNCWKRHGAISSN